MLWTTSRPTPRPEISVTESFIVKPGRNRNSNNSASVRLAAVSIVQNTHGFVPPSQHSFRVGRGGFGDRGGNLPDFREMVTVNAVDFIGAENQPATFVADQQQTFVNARLFVFVPSRCFSKSERFPEGNTHQLERLRRRAVLPQVGLTDFTRLHQASLFGQTMGPQARPGIPGLRVFLARVGIRSCSGRVRLGIRK